MEESISVIGTKASNMEKEYSLQLKVRKNMVNGSMARD
jgi:hypothetical protein